MVIIGLVLIFGSIGYADYTIEVKEAVNDWVWIKKCLLGFALCLPLYIDFKLEDMRDE
jgi:hypothetical protein